MDIAQGNRVDSEKLEQVKTGMTRKQVEFLLGNAAVNDLYHPNHAYYIYFLYHGKEKTEENKVLHLTYQDDILVNIEGSLQQN